MSIRVVGCILAVCGFSIYAWRNWFVSLCAVIVLMAFLQHPDMPHAILGIQGMNPWNLLMFNVLLAWFFRRRQEQLGWEVPRYVVWLFLPYLFVIVWSFSRMLGDYQLLAVASNDPYAWKKVKYTLSWVTSEYLVNCVKWVVPALLVFDACRTRRRAVVCLSIILALYGLLALQTVKHMPLRSVTMNGAELSSLAARLLDKNVGYYRSELSMMFSGAAWAMLCAIPMVQGRRRLALLGLAAVVVLAQAETGGRAGYVTWGVIGLILSVVRWRRLLVILPVVVVALSILLPGVRQRLLMGFGEEGAPGGEEVDLYTVTSGRTLAWSYVIPKIWESPVIGYGRQAMIRTGLYEKLMDGEYASGETFPHPHNAYLELLLDDGFVGFFMVMPFYLVMVGIGLSLVRDRSDPLFCAVGGLGLTLILGLMVAAMGGETFYPRESSLGMWCAIGLMLRLAWERKRSATGGGLFGQEETSPEIDAEGVEAEDVSEPHGIAAW